MPQLQGKKGNPREWIYCWYSRDGGPKSREFARNQRYKLYRTGEFYDIDNDVLENNALKQDELDIEATKARKILQSALEQYKNARPEKFRGKKPKKKKAK